jgi:hypothetical protein
MCHIGKNSFVKVDDKRLPARARRPSGQRRRFLVPFTVATSERIAAPIRMKPVLPGTLMTSLKNIRVENVTMQNF